MQPKGEAPLFLGWQKPFLWSVADYLCQRYRSAQSLDFRNVVLVFPIGRAGRRLLELLVLQAESEKVALIPPQIITSGALPELLYALQKPSASQSQRLLAWVQALREEPGVEKLFARKLGQADLPGWSRLSSKIDRLYLELAAEHLSFDQVKSKLESTSGSSALRWGILQRVAERFLALLEAQGVRDLQQARFSALQQGRCRSDKEVFLVSLPELNSLTCKMLAQSKAQVTALINAPSEMQDYFEADGTLRSARWAKLPIHIAENQIRFVQDFEEQALLAVKQVKAWKQDLPAQQISLGICSASLENSLLQAFERSDCPLHSAAGRSIEHSAPLRVLRSLAILLGNQSFRELGNFLREPLIKFRIERDLKLDNPELFAGMDIVSVLDQCHERHLPAVFRLNGGVPDSIDARSRELLLAIRRILKDFIAPPKTLAEWFKPISTFLLDIIRPDPSSKNDSENLETVEICRLISQQLWELSLASRANCAFTAHDTIELIIANLADQRIPSDAAAQGVELLGWLELQLDDAAALMVTQMNEGFVPESIVQDEFLPDGLRSQLGLLDNAKRLARDKFALCSILRSGREVVLCASRNGLEGNALMPSRLLLSCSGAELAKRIKLFYQGFEAHPETSSVCNESSSWEKVPRPIVGVAPAKKLSITQFRAYLACPYRHYLKYVLGLKKCNDCRLELDALAFGDLTHQILNEFAGSKFAHSQEAQEISLFLQARAEFHFAHRFGSDSEPAVLLQFEQLKQRLSAFALVQAEWASQGWRIMHHEYRLEASSSMLKLDDGRQVQLAGRIDRLDYNQSAQCWAILDYKTGESAKSPEQVHYRKGKGWLDLQLPLYHLLLRQSGAIGSTLQTGYFLLPADQQECSVKLADWSEEELKEAVEVAKRVARDILAGKFWPPAEIKRELDEYALICEQAPEFGL